MCPMSAGPHHIHASHSNAGAASQAISCWGTRSPPPPSRDAPRSLSRQPVWAPCRVLPYGLSSTGSDVAARGCAGTRDAACLFSAGREGFSSEMGRGWLGYGHFEPPLHSQVSSRAWVGCQVCQALLLPPAHVSQWSESGSCLSLLSDAGLCTNACEAKTCLAWVNCTQPQPHSLTWIGGAGDTYMGTWLRAQPGLGPTNSAWHLWGAGCCAGSLERRGLHAVVERGGCATMQSLESRGQRGAGAGRDESSLPCQHVAPSAGSCDLLAMPGEELHLCLAASLCSSCLSELTQPSRMLAGTVRPRGAADGTGDVPPSSPPPTRSSSPGEGLRGAFWLAEPAPSFNQFLALHRKVVQESKRPGAASPQPGINPSQ